VYSAAVLKAFEEAAKKPLGQCFDLIAGTSIGGIIGLGIALEKPMAEVLNAFQDHGSSIFSDRPAPKSFLGRAWDLRRSICKPKYRVDGLTAAVKQILGSETRLEDALHPIIVPTVNVTTGSPQFFKTPHHQKFQSDWKHRVVDIALATSAAPTFFPLAKIENSHFADGGLYANAPDIHALHEAVYFLGAQEAEVHMLSIGTTTSTFSFSHCIGRDLGAWEWMLGSRLLSVIGSAQQQCEVSMMKHRLSERYLRIDENQSKEQQSDLGLDVATRDAQEMLAAMGSESAKRALGDARLIELLSHHANPVTFFHGKRSTGNGGNK